MYEMACRHAGVRLPTPAADENAAVAPCATPAAELEPITLRELREHVGRVALGRVLRLTTLRDAVQLDCLLFPAMDDEGTAVMVGVYNQNEGRFLDKVQLLLRYPLGSRVVIKHPYIKRVRGGDPFVRVDHPANVIVVRPVMGQPSDAETAEEFRRWSGKITLGEYASIVERQNNSLLRSEHLSPTSVATIHNTRAKCFLELEEYVEARAAARTALGLNASSKKARSSLASAQTALGKHQEAANILLRLLWEAPADTTVRTALERAYRRLAESCGDFRRSSECLDDPARRADVASYVGPVEVKMAREGRGRGLFVTEDVAAGTLLLAEKALVLAEADPTRASFALDPTTMKMDATAQGAVLQLALQKARVRPLVNARLHSLYDGSPASASRVPPMKLFKTDDPEDLTPTTASWTCPLWRWATCAASSSSTASGTGKGRTGFCGGRGCGPWPPSSTTPAARTRKGSLRASTRL